MIYIMSVPRGEYSLFVSLMRKMKFVYIREGGDPTIFDDYIKVHLDTGVFTTGRLGCFRIDDCSCHYVDRSEI